MTTRAIEVPSGARRLFVNADLSDGELRAVVLEPGGRPWDDFTEPQVVLVPGKTTETYYLPRYSNTITGDQTKAELVWDGHKDLSVLAGCEISLRFALTNGSLYSFWCE